MHRNSNVTKNKCSKIKFHTQRHSNAQQSCWYNKIVIGFIASYHHISIIGS